MRRSGNAEEGGDWLIDLTFRADGNSGTFRSHARAGEVPAVLKALRKNGLDVVAIHHHMTGTNPTIYFMHYWGTGPAETLATGFKAALGETGKPKAAAATKQ